MLLQIRIPSELFDKSNVSNIKYKISKNNGIININSFNFSKYIEKIQQNNIRLAKSNEIIIYVTLWTDDYNPTLNIYYQKYS